MIQDTQQKKLEELKNFNLISVVGYKKNSTPEVINGPFIKRHNEKLTVRKFLSKKYVDNPDIPTEVYQLFNDSGKESVSFGGVIYKKVVDETSGDVYFDAYKDLTGFYNEVMSILDIKRTLMLLENSTGKFLRTRDLVNMPSFKNIVLENGEANLSFENDNVRGHNLRECTIRLNFSTDDFYFNLDLGTLVYFVYNKR